MNANHAVIVPFPEEQLVTRKQVAKRHQVTVETVKRRERAGLLKPLMMGNTVRHRVADILAYEKAAEAQMPARTLHGTAKSAK